jgi:hypothetical protein
VLLGGTCEASKIKPTSEGHLLSVEHKVRDSPGQQKKARGREASPSVGRNEGGYSGQENKA